MFFRLRHGSSYEINDEIGIDVIDEKRGSNDTVLKSLGKLGKVLQQSRRSGLQRKALRVFLIHL